VSTETKARLGRGLNALLGEGGHGEHVSAEGVETTDKVLSIERIVPNPYQPRKNFDDDEIASLMESIKIHGVLQPLVVRQVENEYQLIAGERRLRAAKAAGLSVVPVRVMNFDDQQVWEASLVENIQRTDLNPLEKAHSFRKYLDTYQVNQEGLAQRLGVDRTTVTSIVNLLQLPADVQEMIRQGFITLGHAKLLKGLNDPIKQSAIAKEVMSKGLSVKALELMLKQQRAEAEAKAAQEAFKEETISMKTAHVIGIENELRSRLAVRFEIRVKDKDKGSIVIGFDNNDDFERVIEALRK